MINKIKTFHAYNTKDNKLHKVIISNININTEKILIKNFHTQIQSKIYDKIMILLK